jgi:signal transduction histidine kinase
MLIVPMKVGDQVIGVISADQDEAGWFRNSDLRLLNALATQAGLAIQRSNALERELKSHRLFDSILRQLSVEEPDQQQTLDAIAAAIREILGEGVSPTINLYNQDEDRFGIHYAYGSLAGALAAPPRPAGIGRYVVETGKPVYLEDLTKPPAGAPKIRDEAMALGIKSLAAIPIRRHEQVTGVLFINSQTQLAFDDEARRILEMFADQAGIAIDIARFHASAQLQGALVKAADLGFLAGGIAHEFRNYLQNIEIHISGIEQLPEQEGRVVLTDRLRSEAARASKTIGVFQSFARQRDIVETFNLEDLIKRIRDVSAQRLKDHDIELEFINAGVKDVTMNVSFVSSIVLNLLRNAIDALERKEGGSKIVGLELSHHADGNIAIVAKDSGPGISPDELNKLFIPFRTTRTAGKGLGLGLFWVQRIVSQMGGRIDVESPNNWGGATFRVVLPSEQRRKRQED